MNHIQLTIKASEEEQEKLIASLLELDASGFEQTDESLIAYFEEHNFKSYEVLRVINELPFTQAVIAPKNWNEVWEKDFQPVVVDDFCAVRAHFHPPISSVKHEIVITPKMSFGTGHHATTYMMLQQMQFINFSGKKVFDFGTGTGVLAILAEKLGALSVAAIDNDEWSIANASENIKNNACTRISVFQSSNVPDTEFDVILANINRNVILDYMPHLKKAVVPNGYILFSGLLHTDKDAIENACTQYNMQLVTSANRTNWICLLFVNRI